MCHLKFMSQLEVLLWDKELLAKYLISTGVSPDVIKGPLLLMLEHIVTILGLCRCSNSPDI